jgi:hypothetical protein
MKIIILSYSIERKYLGFYFNYVMHYSNTLRPCEGMLRGGLRFKTLCSNRLVKMERCLHRPLILS